MPHATHGRVPHQVVSVLMTNWGDFDELLSVLLQNGGNVGAQSRACWEPGTALTPFTCDSEPLLLIAWKR